MARKAKKKPNENLAQKFELGPLYSTVGVLAAIGRPVFNFLTLLVKIFVFVLVNTGHLIALIWESVAYFINLKVVKGLKRKKKKLKPFIKKYRKKSVRSIYQFWQITKSGIESFISKLKQIHPPKLSFPEKDLSKFRQSLKLERLRFSLFELKLVSKIKKVLSFPFTRLFKLKLKKRIILGTFVFVLMAGITAFYIIFYKPLPHPTELGKRTPQVSTKIYDRNGILLYKIYRDENRSIVPLSQIPIHVRLATLAAEDAEFYENPGFSIKGIVRALIQNINSRDLQGGSTITQQLVKNVLLTPERTLTRKIKELILAIEVEATYTKDQILEMYLNQVGYGGTAYGIAEAAEEYFGKNIRDLNLAEAAFLAGLPQSPTAHSPYGQTPELGIRRQKEVLHLMTVNKFITPFQEAEATKESLVFVPKRNQILAPHFVMYIRQMLVDKYGEDMVEKGGLEVTTSLDLSIQQMAEHVVSSEVNKIRNLNVGNGAALVVKPQTGEILAMVGSKDYFDKTGDGQVNVTARLRQPGSSIKVVNYAYALQSANFTPATYINDSPITYIIPGSQPYKPVNYDGRFKGNVTLRNALAQSRNIPAVKILASYGVPKMVEQGQKMGIKSWDNPAKFGLSLTLGGGAVTALDMARVYSTFANYGETPELIPILSVKNYKGRLLESNSPKLRRSLDTRAAFLMNSILSDNNARAPEFGFNSFLNIPGHPEVAVKTGTSNDLRDNWTDGYNKDYLVITWVGNNNNAPMSRIASGVTGASPIWNKIMSALLQGKSSVEWKVPEGVTRITCPGGKSEWFMSDRILPTFCAPPPSPQPSGKPEDKILNGASTSR
jgi:penicillin-binding protein 1C